MTPARAPHVSRTFLAVVVAVSALQPFALNVLAPATPGLARSLDTDYATIQLTLTLYLLAVAMTQLIVGPISDIVGTTAVILHVLRRPNLLDRPLRQHLLVLVPRHRRFPRVHLPHRRKV